MYESTPISDLWSAFGATAVAHREAVDRVHRAEARNGYAALGYRHPRVVIADAVADEIGIRLRDLRKAILTRPVADAESWDVLREMARTFTTEDHTPADVRDAMKRARQAGWRVAG